MECNHVRLEKMLVGEGYWYVCTTCPQKFKIEPWDGKVRVIAAATSENVKSVSLDLEDYQ